MRVDHLLKIWCPKCKAVNYVCAGTEGSGPYGGGEDVSGLICYSCKHQELFDSDTERTMWEMEEPGLTFEQWQKQCLFFIEGSPTP